MFIALLMGIAVMYLVLVMQFGSFTAPLPVMLSLPLSLIGVVLALLLTGGIAEPHEPHRRDHADGPGGQERHPAAGLRTRKEEAQGVDREEALMHAGRMRLRPILMTTFALIAGMMPVAIGMGEGGEFYRPMAVAIIGGIITSTLLTLLVIPTLLRQHRDLARALRLKFHARAERMNPFVAFLVTFLELFATLLLWRFLFRLFRWILNVPTPRLHPVERAAQVGDFKTPEWCKPRPQWWQRERRASTPRTSNPYAPRPALAD